MEPLLVVDQLCKRFPVRKGFFGREVGRVHAVEGVSFTLDAGRSLGLVGESGCGKTTTGRCLLRLIEPTSGSVRFHGTELLDLPPAALRRQRRHLQMIFQDPYGSLNARMTVGEMLAEPMRVHQLVDPDAIDDRVVELLRRVDLPPASRDHYPHQFSGGQRQRIGIARALAVQPQLIVCDEPVSALDVSVQAQVVNLLQDLQESEGLSYLFIAHDLAVVAHLCHEVAVMYLGQIVEQGPVEAIYQRPLHPYTQALLSAIPPDRPGEHRQRKPVAGEPPSPMQPPGPEPIRQRFPAYAAAFDGPMAWHEIEPGHGVRCSDPVALERLASAGV